MNLFPELFDSMDAKNNPAKSVRGEELLMPKKLYHLTLKEHLPSIQKNGLIPKHGPLTRALKGQLYKLAQQRELIAPDMNLEEYIQSFKPRIYLASTKEDALFWKTKMPNHEDFALLEISVPDTLDLTLNGMEWTTLETIPAKYIMEVKDNPATCPLASYDLEVNTNNRDHAIAAKHIQYGPLNLNDEAYWERYAKKWNTTPEVAKQSNCSNCIAFDISPRMKKCMPGKTSDNEGELGYCWMHHFKCHSARTCYTWAAGGPIELDSISHDWQKRNAQVKNNPPGIPKPGKELSMKRKREIRKRWLELVNMTHKELKRFYDSDLGNKRAGLSRDEAKEAGISSGRDSALAIMKMKQTPVKDWHKTRSKDRGRGIMLDFWQWAQKQINFNTRHRAMKGAYLDDKGRPKRKLLGLWIWGHDPWRYALKVDPEPMPPCPNKPWVGSREKKAFGVQEGDK